jgi:hypothetical protein
MLAGLGLPPEVSFPSLSRKRPPPPGPPGIYLRRFGGGSVAVAAASLSRRLEFVEGRESLGRLLRALAEASLGVLGLGAILLIMSSDIYVFDDDR